MTRKFNFGLDVQKANPSLLFCRLVFHYSGHGGQVPDNEGHKVKMFSANPQTSVIPSGETHVIRVGPPKESGFHDCIYPLGEIYARIIR